MNVETIQDEIFRHCGIKTALRWKIIATELKGNLLKNLQIRAYHVSVRRKDMAAAKFVLTRKIFAKHRRSHFIGGSPMRLIPIMKDISPNHKQKCLYYIALQSSFLQKIDSMESWEIINLNNDAIGLNGASLRRLILEIPLRDEPSRQAFLSVDRAFNNASTKFYFYKNNASECRSRITTLLPYLVFTNPSKEKGIKSCFSGEANDRAKGVKWDPERMEVTTADDEILEMYQSLYEEDDIKTLLTSLHGKYFSILLKLMAPLWHSSLLPKRPRSKKRRRHRYFPALPSHRADNSMAKDKAKVPTSLMMKKTAMIRLARSTRRFPWRTQSGCQAYLLRIFKPKWT
jgi:hypothetical protein